jgi:hypothetical protein
MAKNPKQALAFLPEILLNSCLVAMGLGYEWPDYGHSGLRVTLNRNLTVKSRKRWPAEPHEALVRTALAHTWRPASFPSIFSSN